MVTRRQQNYQVLSSIMRYAGFYRLSPLYIWAVSCSHNVNTYSRSSWIQLLSFTPKPDQLAVTGNRYQSPERSVDSPEEEESNPDLFAANTIITSHNSCRGRQGIPQAKISPTLMYRRKTVSIKYGRPDVRFIDTLSRDREDDTHMYHHETIYASPSSANMEMSSPYREALDDKLTALWRRRR